MFVNMEELVLLTCQKMSNPLFESLILRSVMELRSSLSSPTMTLQNHPNLPRVNRLSAAFHVTFGAVWKKPGRFHQEVSTPS